MKKRLLWFAGIILVIAIAFFFPKVVGVKTFISPDNPNTTKCFGFAVYKWYSDGADMTCFGIPYTYNEFATNHPVSNSQ